MFENKFDFKILTMFIMATTTTTKPVGGHKMENKKTSKLTVTLELSVEELDLIRHATWSLERELQKDIKEYTLEKEDSFYKTKPYWIRANEINKDMFFDSTILRDKIVSVHGDIFNTNDERQAYEKEHNLKPGNISSRYSNTRKD